MGKGLIKKVDRIAFAVGDLDEARRFMEDVLGGVAGPVDDVREFKFRYQTFELGGQQLELLCPYDPSSVLSHFLMKQSQGFHHLSCEVDSLDDAISELEAKGLEVVSRHRYEEILEGFQWEGAFLHPKDAFGILIHLVQKKAA